VATNFRNRISMQSHVHGVNRASLLFLVGKGIFFISSYVWCSEFCFPLGRWTIDIPCKLFIEVGEGAVGNSILQNRTFYFGEPP